MHPWVTGHLIFLVLTALFRLKEKYIRLKY